MRTRSLVMALLLTALVAWSAPDPAAAGFFAETAKQTHEGDHFDPIPPDPGSGPYYGNGVFTADQGVDLTSTHTEFTFVDDVLVGGFPQREEFALGDADLSTGTLKAQITGAMRQSGLPGGTITSALAAISDSVTLGRAGGPPFGRLSGDVVTFTLDIGGSISVNNPVPGSNFNASIIALIIAKKGTLTPLLAFQSPNWICSFYWGIGSDANVRYTNGGSVVQLPLISKITSPTTLTASCPSGPEFDWAIAIRPSYVAVNVSDWDFNLASTVNASLFLPAGVTTDNTDSGSTLPAGDPPPVLPPLDHYLSYKTTSTKGDVCTDAPVNENKACQTEEDCGGVSDPDNPTTYCLPDKFPKGLRVTLSDRLEPGGRLYDVKMPLTLCTPADKNGEGVTDPATHLRSYQIGLTAAKQCVEGLLPLQGAACSKETDCGGTKGVTRYCRVQEKSAKQTGLTVRNQFHLSGLVVDVTTPDRLLVPTSKNLTAPPDPPGAVNVDHYKCYKVSMPKLPKFTTIANVAVDDQFTNANKLFDLKKPMHLCMVAAKNAEGVVNPTQNLLCYQATPAKGQPSHVPVKGLYLSNQLDTEQANTSKEEEFCVPSEVDLPPAI